MKKLIVTLAALASGWAFGAGDVVVETSTFALTIGADAKAKSLKLKANGEEMLDVHEGLPLFSVKQDRPFNNEIKLTFPNCETVFNANRVRREGDCLIVGFELVSYEAKIRVTEKNGYALFELVDFILGPKGTDHLKMTYPPARSLKLLDLPVKDRANYGQWMNSVWDDKGAVAVMAAEPFTWIEGTARHGFRLLSAEARRDLKLRGAKAALVAASTTETFLDGIDAMETDLGLPQGVKSRRSKEVNRSVYWTSSINPKNVDAHIALAKRGGFGLMLIYYPAVCTGAQGNRGYAGIADYEPAEEYPKGYASIREMLAKIKAAGITPGLHVLQTFIGMYTHYVTPIADPRLNLTRHFTLAKALGEDGGDLFVQEDPSNCPTNVESRVLRFGGELISYAGYTTERPFKFTGVKRGHWKTNVTAHERGQIGGILDVCEYGAVSCYIDQDSDLQEEVADKIARIYNCGFEFMYNDGSEGVSMPAGIHVPRAQYLIWQRMEKKPLFMEGAAKAHFGWHHQSGANAFDYFPPEEFKPMIVRWPQYEAPIIRQDLTRLNFGWWKLFQPGQKVRLHTPERPEITSVGTQMDMWEFGTSRAAAWNCPMTVMLDPDAAAKHPRIDDLMEVVRRWEDVRARDWLTPEMKERLKSSTQEHHLYLNEKGDYELCDSEMLPTPANAPTLRGFVFERNGKRTVAYWHTAASGQATFALGPNGEPLTVFADKLRYLETTLSKDAVKAAFAAATLK